MKRIFDFFFAFLGLIMLAPMMGLTMLGTWLFMGSPVLFKQERPGYHGKLFLLYKFRTMFDYTDEKGRLLPDAMRITAFGKFIRRYSLDELPQLFNVLKGDMSLVGPRPLLIDYLPLYNAEQARRHKVRPGITGWAQVNGRNAISWEEKFKLDVWYVDHQSFGLDMKILWMTISSVLHRSGINQKEDTPMEKFRGQNSQEVH